MLVGQLEKMSFHERRSSALGYRPHALPLDGMYKCNNSIVSKHVRYCYNFSDTSRHLLY